LAYASCHPNEGREREGGGHGQKELERRREGRRGGRREGGREGGREREREGLTVDVGPVGEELVRLPNFRLGSGGLSGKRALEG
jgi:hypothetical protein